DLVIKIVEHFLPLFVGTYSAAPYRLDFADMHPEAAPPFLGIILLPAMLLILRPIVNSLWGLSLPVMVYLAAVVIAYGWGEGIGRLEPPDAAFLSGPLVGGFHLHRPQRSHRGDHRVPCPSPPHMNEPIVKKIEAHDDWLDGALAQCGRCNGYQ
ncbi:MAG: hypothetical protein QNJ61_17635, partial [Desulfobacterales bacterium]|nr:hypothetical protein [Desulfobacterales bacterium]